MKTFLYLALLVSASGATGGCATFTRAQMDLVTQARRGVTYVAQNDQDRDRAIAELAKIRRDRLDQAFDEDVKLRATQESLDPEWVIEARKAYASALDAYGKTQAAAERASADRKRNLAAVDAALERLAWMQSIQLKLNLLPDELPNEVQK